MDVNELIQGLENLANVILRVQHCFSLVVYVRGPEMVVVVRIVAKRCTAKHIASMKYV